MKYLKNNKTDIHSYFSINAINVSTQFLRQNKIGDFFRNET